MVIEEQTSTYLARSRLVCDCVRARVDYKSVTDQLRAELCRYGRSPP